MDIYLVRVVSAAGDLSREVLVKAGDAGHAKRIIEDILKDGWIVDRVVVTNVV